MRICRFDDNRLGVVTGDGIHDVTQTLKELPTWTYPLPRFDPFITELPRLSGTMERQARQSAPKPVDGVRLLSPVASPGKIIAAPVNYKKHLEEVLAQKELHHGNLINEIHKAGLFLKATSSLIGAGETIELIHLDRRNDHEIELAVIIGKPTRNVSAADALSHVAGYCIGLDITIRGPEERSFRKSPDSYTVLGPWLVTADELKDPSQLAFTITVNQISNGTATLNWTAVTQNTNGTVLTNLAGYKVHYGTSPSAMNTIVVLSNPSLTTYLVTNLSPGTWYFGTTAYTSTGIESSLSNVGSKTVN